MSDQQKVKSVLYSEVRKMCREVGVYLDVEFEDESLDLISELIWSKLQIFGVDLDAFQKHAKRSTVTADDVKLLARRNDSLKKYLQDKFEEISKNKTEEKTLKRKRTVTKAASK